MICSLFRAVAGRVGLGTTEKMSPSLQAYLTDNNTVLVYADEQMITENVTLLDGAVVAILGGVNDIIAYEKLIILGQSTGYSRYLAHTIISPWAYECEIFHNM